MSQSRREFIQKAGCGALSLATLASGVQSLGLMSAFAQKNIDSQRKINTEKELSPNAFTDYKALVCLFFAGGLDTNNIVIPNHSDANISNYAAYSGARTASTLAVSQNQLLPINVPQLGNLSYGFHPNLPAFQSLYNSGRLAVLCNVGTLVFPMTRTQYRDNSIKKPYQLFSHSDQVQQHQSSRSDMTSYSGWGGRISDKLRPEDSATPVPMITSIAGSQVFTSGQTTSPLIINTGNLNQQLVLNDFTESTSTQRKNSMVALRSLDLPSNNLIKAASETMNTAVQAGQALSVNPSTVTTFPTTRLGQQLLQVARMISLRNSFNIHRQIFFVQINDWDTHSDQISTHTTLLNQVSQAVNAFWSCINTELNIGSQVTLFTMSDFSRTFQPSGSGGSVGTDHAWGGHQFILGGSVAGGNFYGGTRPDGSGNIYPTLQMGGPDDTDGGSNPRGRWIPTTSVDQYAATLASWFGVAPTDLSTVFPTLGNFGSNNMGFML